MLILTSFLWGSSFPVIKIIVTHVSEYFYVGFRSLLAIIGLSPYVIYCMYTYRGRLSESVRGGLLTGIVYTLGLWLQGWGTRYTSASNSAFITGLNVIFVHLYAGIVAKTYSVNLGLALLLSIAGLYMITIPSTGFNIGDFLVLLGSLMWALQVIFVDKYCHGDPIIFTFFEMMPALTFLAPSLPHALGSINLEITLLFIYLALICGDVAFILQVMGQRQVNPGAAAIVFLLEPVFAAILSRILIGEIMSTLQILGSILILLAILTATYERKYL